MSFKETILYKNLTEKTTKTKKVNVYVKKKETCIFSKFIKKN